MASTLKYLRDIDLRRASNDALRLYISQEGKRLNWQIAEIEKSPSLVKQSFAYKNLTEKSYNRQYLGLSKSGHTKINLSTRGLERGQLQELAGIIKRQISMQTMTKSGIKDYYKRVFESLRKKYPGLSKFTDEQLSDILTTTGFESSKGFEGSDRIFNKIAQSNDVNSIVGYIEKSGGMTTIMQADETYRQLVNTNFQYNPFVNED